MTRLHFMRTSRTHILFFGAALALAGCGTPGAPLPPSLRLPKVVTDLQAIRKGDDVYLRWTVPTKTTDASTIRANGLGTTRICRGYVTSGPNTCRDLAADITTHPDTSGMATAVDHITNYIGGNRDFLSYTVEVNNENGRNAGPSNAVIIFVAPSLAAPPALEAKLGPHDVGLTWEAHDTPVSVNLKSEFFYRIKRSLRDSDQKNAAPAILAELPAHPGVMTFADRSFTWEKTYDYRVCGITRVIGGDGTTLAEFEGQDSPAAVVVAHDIFPPPVPSGLQAVYSSLDQRRFIDLTWSPIVENDIGGYNVYRSEGEETSVKINSDLVKTSAFRDEHVAVGKTYFYTVTSVDARGNESAHSQAANEKVPE